MDRAFRRFGHYVRAPRLAVDSKNQASQLAIAGITRPAIVFLSKFADTSAKE